MLFRSSISISTEFLALTEWLCPSQTGLPFSPLLETHCSTSQSPTLFQHVLCCPFNPEVFPGKRAEHRAPDLPSHSPPRLPTRLISPADAINQFDATAAESQAIMENRPGALELTLTEGPGKPPSRQWGREGGRTGQANACQPRLCKRSTWEVLINTHTHIHAHPRYKCPG